MVMRERARESRPDVSLTLDVVRPTDAGDEWHVAFERRVRDVASRAVAHIKRGDRVAVLTTVGGVSRADRVVGADPLLRFLALVDPVTRSPSMAGQEAAE